MLTLEDVRRIAQLARIRLSPEETARYHKELEGIFAFIEQIEAADTSGVTPMAHAQEVYQRLREDVVTEPDRRETYLALASQTEEGLYLVPKVIE